MHPWGNLTYIETTTYVNIDIAFEAKNNFLTKGKVHLSGWKLPL